MTWLGIDVGGTKIEAAVSSGDGVRLLPRVATPREYPAFLAAVAGLVASAGGPRGVPALGIGLPGQVERERVVWVPNLGFLDGASLVEDLRGLAVGGDIVLANDAQLALLGEAWRGSAADARQAVMIALGTGVGGGILAGGRLVRGTHGAAGSLGWLNLDAAEPPDPRHGYLERHCSGTGLGQLGRTLVPPRDAPTLVGDARNGDASCLGALAHLGTRLGVGLASVASVFDPEIVVVGGGLVDAWDLLGPSVAEAYATYAAPYALEVPIVPAALGSHAAAYGALRAAMLGDAAWL